MRRKVPWSEMATLGALYAAVATWSAAGTPGLAGVVALAMALLLAWSPRMLAWRASPSVGAAIPSGVDPWDPTRIAAALGAVAAACAPAATGTAGRGLALAHAVMESLWLGAGTYAVLTLRAARPQRTAAITAAVLVALAMGLLLVPGRHAFVDRPLVPAALCALLAVVLAARYGRPAEPADRARLILPAWGLALGAALLLLAAASHDPTGTGHALFALGTLCAGVGLVAGAGGRPLRAASNVARSVLAASAGATVGAYLAWRFEHPVWAVAVGAVVTAGVLPALFSRSLRPDGARLIAACVRATDALRGTERLDDIAVAVLDPLRGAARDLRAPAALWILAGDRRYTLDVAGAPLVGRLGQKSDRALTAWLRAHPGRVAWVDAFRPLEVRRPELRAVIAALDEHEAIAAIPLVHADDLLGAILVPRGRRTALPGLDDEDALMELARRAAGAVSIALAFEAAVERARDAHAARVAADEIAARAQAERDAARRRLHGAGPVRALGSLERAWVGYGEAMRGLLEKARALGPLDAPVTLIAEPGCAPGAVLRVLHESSPRSSGPCVVLDGASVHPRDALAALVGEDNGVDGAEGTSGWLEVADDGTILLLDLPALGHDAAVALLEALRTGSFRRAGATEARPLRARVVVGLRVAPAQSGLPAELCDRLGEHVLRLPPLRERPEDLDTLVLFGIDRACRVLGRGAIGIRREAMELLRAHAWPGNEAELYAALEHAAARASGTQIAADDLPGALRGVPSGLPAGVQSRDGRDGDGESYDALERRILQAALDRAGGNKSEAARALGIARTTFLDKLRKYGLRP